ncbi:MAG: ABC transporter ATP-binding protein [Desulfomonilaceae bacterium]
MPCIELAEVSNHVCRKINLRIEDGDIFVIVGPTGAGKTTLLNIMAGLVDYTGHVLIDSVNMDGASPSERSVGYLFQELALFPHLTVESNIAFGLRAQRYEKELTEKRVDALMEMLRIKHLKGRYPGSLSGGEQKRVALARSLAPRPRVLLLDEPTSSLDVETADHLRRELHSFLKRLGITTVLVTHNLLEARKIADKAAVMSEGMISEVTDLAHLLVRPLRDFVPRSVANRQPTGLYVNNSG